MILHPVRKLSFSASGSRYDFDIDADLQRDKAEEIAAILEDEGLEPELGNLPMKRIILVASGTIRPVGMRRITQVLAS